MRSMEAYPKAATERVMKVQHVMFQDERWYDVIEILDDATSEIYYAQLLEEERA